MIPCGCLVVCGSSLSVLVWLVVIGGALDDGLLMNACPPGTLFLVSPGIDVSRTGV